MTRHTEPICVDCRQEGVAHQRDIVGGGPRTPLCATHVRARKKQRRDKAHGRHVETTYNISADAYQKLYRKQNGRCYICGRARGLSKRLSVDHDHRCCAESRSCGRCIRGLLCAKCNEIMGYFRDDVNCFARGVDYLLSPPAQRR